MNKDLEIVVELIKSWEKFRENGGANLEEFSFWLFRNFNASDAQNGSTNHAMGTKALPQKDNENVNAKISHLWGQLERYKHNLVKKAFKDLPIKTVDEFGFLSFVEERKNPKKADYIKCSLLETTTSFEMMKRMYKLGLINEEIDKDDKRSKRIQLTEKGQIVLEQARIKINQVNLITLGDLSPRKKDTVLEIFSYLNAFQQKVHKDYQEENLDKIISKEFLQG